MLTKEENQLITQVSPGTPGGEYWRRFWIPFLMSWEVPEPDCPPIRMRLLGEDLIAFRTTSGKVGLLGNHCPHRGASLFFGRNEEEGLRCVYHGWKYDVEGHCVDMPNEPPESNFKHKIQHTAYPCIERAGLVWTYMGPKELEPEMPEMGWMQVPESHRFIRKMATESNWLQALEGDIDNSHTGFLHATIAGPPSLSFHERLRLGYEERMANRRPGQVQERANAPQPFDISPRGIVKETDYGIIMAWQRRGWEDTKRHYHINHWMLPSYAQVVSNLCNVRVPVDDENSWFFRVQWSLERPLSDEQRSVLEAGGSFFPEMIPGTFRPVENKDNDYMVNRELQKTTLVSGVVSQTQQDRAVTETMGAIYQRNQEHLGTSDAVIIQMRRRLMREIRNLMEGREPFAAHHGDLYRIRGINVELEMNADWEEGARSLMEVPAAAR